MVFKNSQLDRMYDAQIHVFSGLSVSDLVNVYVAWTTSAKNAPKGSTFHEFSLSMIDWLSVRIRDLVG